MAGPLVHASWASELSGAPGGADSESTPACGCKRSAPWGGPHFCQDTRFGMAAWRPGCSRHVSGAGTRGSGSERPGGGGRSLQPSYARGHVVTSEQKPLAPPRRLHGGHESPELAELAISQDRSSAVGEFQELGLVWERVPWVGASLLRRGPGRQHPSLGQPPPGFRAKQKFLW